MVEARALVENSGRKGATAAASSAGGAVAARARASENAAMKIGATGDCSHSGVAHRVLKASGTAEAPTEATTVHRPCRHVHAHTVRAIRQRQEAGEVVEF